MNIKTMILAAALSAAPGLLHAQFDFKISDKNVQVHSFASQGFIYSNQNEYLTMKTSDGSAAFTDFGINISTALTDKLRVGAQLYDRNVGKLGNYHPSLDWAFADYRLKDWFGVRGGKVKTVLGLYNDTQDMEFLHPWALLPQAVYPIDQRGETIAHVGVDIYGQIAVHKLGNLNYTFYAGKRPNDSQGGFIYAMDTAKMTNRPNEPMPFWSPADAASMRHMDDNTGPVYGGDLRWNTPLKGVVAGASYLHEDLTAHGTYVATNAKFTLKDKKDDTLGWYAQYTLGNLEIDGEYRRQIRQWFSWTGDVQPAVPNSKDSRFGYLSAAYRLNKRLELGTYHSRFYYTWAAPRGLPRNHIFDQVVTARIDLSSFMDLKLEGHFLDGAVTSNITNRGFYAADNPNGIAPTTRMFVARLGFHL
jgi:hypothetical protein